MMGQNLSDVIRMGNGGRVEMHEVNIVCHYAKHDVRQFYRDINEKAYTGTFASKHETSLRLRNAF